MYTARTPILLDTFLGHVFNKEGLTTLFAIRYYLDIAGIPYRLVDEPEEELQRLGPTLDPNDTAALPLVITLRDRCWPLRGQIAMERISDTLLLNELYRYYAVYRWAPAPASGDCQLTLPWTTSASSSPTMVKMCLAPL